MSPVATADPPAMLSRLKVCLQNGDFATVDQLLSQDDALAGSHAIRALVETLMRRQRWVEAAFLLDRLPDADSAIRMKRNLARNLSSAQKHRPALYELLVQLPAQNYCNIAIVAADLPTLTLRRPDGSVLSLSPGNDPLRALEQCLAQLNGVINAGEAIGLCGVGDGYLLKELAEHPPSLFLGMQQTVHLIEPDGQILLQAMLIHDYSGPRGPIEQTRFQWHIGPEWEEQLRQTAESDPFLPLPAIALSLSPGAAAALGAIQRCTADLVRRSEAVQQDINAHYAGLPARAERYSKTRATDLSTPSLQTQSRPSPRPSPGVPGEGVGRDHFQTLFGDRPPRPPRVLLVTTRFSTVLQYSTRDAAAGFEQIGWQTRVLIEPSPCHRLLRPGMQQAVAEFKPDLVLQLDHLRHEHGGLFPPALPFVCWIQDHLPNLTTPAAGARLGKRDFVLTGSAGMYTTRYEYPPRQCIEISKLTRVPTRPASWESTGDDVVYVSTASMLPRDLASRIINEAGGDAAVREIVSGCCDRIIEVYEQGGALPAAHSVRLVLEQVEREARLRLSPDAFRQSLIDALFDRLGNTLYRQQALKWAAEAAGKLGLTLAVYGPGWEKHPELHRFARGPVAYGPDLEHLTRNSKINLVLEPFFAVSHQRLLDALVAGGFVLVREHPANSLQQQLLNFVCDNTSAAAESVEQVRLALDPGRTIAFDELLDRCAFLWDQGDPVSLVRGAMRAGLMRRQDTPLPHLPEVSFANSVELEQRLASFISSPEKRRRVAAEQRAEIEERLSYAAGMSRVVRRIGHLLATEART